MHLIKLSVGTQSVESLADWQANHAPYRLKGRVYHPTRMWPRKADEILASGGSIYWVIQGHVQARQKIAAFEELTAEDGTRRCAICLEPDLIRVAVTPRRPFQGWRYLDPKDAPPDLRSAGTDEALPPEISAALAEIGVL